MLWVHLCEEQDQLLRRKGPLGKDFRGRPIVQSRPKHVVASLELQVGVVFEVKLIKLVLEEHRPERGGRVEHLRLD